MANIFLKSWSVWKPVRPSEDDTNAQESLLSGSTMGFEKRRQAKQWNLGTTLTLINTVILLVTMGSIGFLMASRPRCDVAPQDRLLFSALGFESQPQARNKSRWSSDESTSVFLRGPSPEVDAAWDELSLEHQEMTTISGAQARALGRDTAILAKVPESWGLGTDRYFAQVQVFHMIHCLDEIRKQMHYDHYYLAKHGKTPPPEFINHKNHCLHMLLENLICQSSTDIILHNWRETYHVPLADFNPPRECRNFDALREWGQQHAIPGYRSKWSTLRVPTDAVVLPAPTPRLY